MFNGSHLHVFYPMIDNTQLANVLKLNPIDLSLFFGFIVHGYLQNAGAKYPDYQNMCYHVYLMSATISTLDGIFYSDGASFSFFGEAIGTDTGNESKEEVIDVIFITPKRIGKGLVPFM